MAQKLGGGCAIFSGGCWVPIEHKVFWAEPYLHTKCHLNTSSRLVTTKMGRQWGGSAPFLGRELGLHLAQCGLEQRPPPCRVPFWSIQPFGHIRHGPKIGEGSSPPLSGSESNVVWAEAYLRTKWHLDQCSRLAATEMGRKLGRGLCPPMEL